MNDFVAIVGLVSGVASILGLFLPAQGWKQRIMHALYGLTIAILASIALNYQSRISSLTAIETQATALLKAADFHDSGSARGFILASLSFLEKHKENLPDTYARAVKLSENSGVLVNEQESGSARLVQDWSMQETAEAMKQLIRGIAIQGGGD